MLCMQEVLALHSRLEARAKALISLEEMQAANRPTVRTTHRDGPRSASFDGSSQGLLIT